MSPSSTIIASLFLSLTTAASAQNIYSPVVLDPTYRTVLAPKHEDFPQDPDHIRVVSAILFTVCLTFVGISIRESKKWHSTVPAALTIGSASCVLAEAINCYLANVWWTVSGDPKQLLFTLLGRDFDIYVGIVWCSFGSALSCVLFAALARNARTGVIWTLLGLAAFSDFVLEECMLNYGGIYTYYGHQPLVLFKLFPCWWAFCNVSGMFFGISIAFRYRESFKGWRSIFLLPLLPWCYVGPQVLAGLPTMYSLQADWSPLVSQLCGITSCCIAIVHTGFVMDALLGRDPLDFAGVAKNEKVAKVQKLR